MQNSELTRRLFKDSASIFKTLEMLAPYVSAPFYWMDLEGRFLGLNKPEAIGAAKKEDLIGKTVYEIYPRDVADKLHQDIQEVIRTGKESHLEDEIVDYTTGKFRYYMATRSPLRDYHGNIIGIVANSIETTAQKEAERLRIELANQVAHDIRSPLAALNLCTKDAKALPEQQRILIRNAINRINDIANNLLSQHKDTKAPSEKSGTWLIAPVIDSMISEKRLLLEGQNIKLDSQIRASGFGAFATFNPSKIKRVLSNLINNAAEALKGKAGAVDVILETSDTHVIIKVKDNGCGIPANKLSEVMHGLSLKETGHGLGLSHAKKYVESLHGKLVLTSEENKGTTIELHLLKAQPPRWFVSEIVVSPKIPIAILDDDRSVHNAWEQLLMRVSPELNIQHFSTTTELIHWYQTQNTAVQILSDYELLGESTSGLDMLEQLNAGPGNVLVTSHYENPDIITRCEKLGIGLLPKNLLASVPVHLKSTQTNTCDHVLIDDDVMIHQLWQLFACKKKKRLACFKSTAEFEQQALSNLPKNTPIYIDSHLGEHTESGQDYAKRLFAQGFNQLYLATGHSASHFGNMPWIKAVVGKEPPF